MGMTIEEAIHTMEYYDECDVKTQYKAREKAVGVMQKYRKMQEIINNTDYIEEDVIKYKMICEVAEDGKID